MAFWRVLIGLVILFTCCCVSQATLTDIECLKSIKKSFQDPLGYLASSWNFGNVSEGNICKFAGVECWHPDENRVLNIKLPDMGLRGQFPLGFINCSSLTGLDLSNNNLSGTIPSDISDRLSFVTTLDLSSNNFSGEIPSGLAKCTYLNVLRLNNNRFNGTIPLELGGLDRLKEFSVANNLLTGPVPSFQKSTITAEAYVNNQGLCGKLLSVCPGTRKKPHVGVIVGAAIGGITITALIVGVILYYLLHGAVKKKEDDPEGNRWAKSIKGTKGIKVSMFKKTVSKMRLSDLMEATDNFSNKNIIGTGRTGTMYLGLLPDGCSLMVKRLQDSRHLEKEFVSEMKILGSIEHRNLVPLLGFCMAKKERLLVYKFMENGTLYDKIHPVEPDVKSLEWPLRLKVAIGAARGLAWLHHSCNPRILHRNISSKCILLDGEFEPKLSDFGLARLMNPIDTHLSTFVNGEFGDLGYVAPEYPRTLVATPKGDVYSFGVVLLELITGEKPTHLANAPDNFKGSLAEWIEHLSQNSALQAAFDKSLVGNGFDSELNQFLKVACNCVLPTPKNRPTMFEVYQLLRAIGEKYQFTADNEIMLLPDSNDAKFQDELIVAPEGV